MKLYKYMRVLDDIICPQKEKCGEYKEAKVSERLRKMLTDSRIYLSNPKIFNDPFDGYFSIQFGTEYDKADAKKKVEQLKRKDYQVKERADNLMKNDFTRILLENFRVACFSEDDLNDLMWAHYADQHKGICLVYEIDSNISESFIQENKCLVFREIEGKEDVDYGCAGGDVRLSLGKIDYSERKDFLKIRDGKVEENYDVRKAIYTKSKIWEYEHEIRLVAELSFGEAFGEEKYFCRVNKRVLKEVRFGIQLEDKYQQEIIQMIRADREYDDVVFKKARLNVDDFLIDYEKI